MSWIGSKKQIADVTTEAERSWHKIFTALVGVNDYVTRVKERERKRRIHSEQKFIGFFDTDDDMATVRVTAPKMLADLGDTVILEQLKGQQ